MFYKLSNNIGLRKWKYVDRAIYIKGIECALGVSQEEFDTLLLCDGSHDLENNETIENLIKKHYIVPCKQNENTSEWSKLKIYDNMYFPKMNLMIT